MESIGSCTTMNCYDYFSLSIWKDLVCFSAHSPDSVWCPHIVNVLSRNPDLALKEKLRTEYFCNRPRLLQTCLPKALSPAGLQGRWSCWQPAVWPYTFCHRRVIFPDLKNLMAHECWADFIKQINMTTSLLKTSGSSHCQCCGVYAFFSQALFGPSNSGQGVWRVFCVWHGQSEK